MRLKPTPRAIHATTVLRGAPSTSLSWESVDRFGQPVRHSVEEFALGVMDHDARKAGFSGRPALIRSLLPAIMDAVRGVSPDVAERRLVALRHFFRFLDAHEASGGATTQDVAQITPAIGTLFRTHLLTETRRTNPMLLATVSTIVQGARAHRGLPALDWPIIAKAKVPLAHRDVDPLAISRLRAYALRRMRTIAPLHLKDITPVLGGLDTDNPAHVLGVMVEDIEAALLHGRKLPLDRQDFFTRCFTIDARKRRAARSGKPEETSTYRAALVPSSDEIICAYAVIAADTGWLDAAKALSLDTPWFLPRETNPHSGEPVRGMVITHRSKTGTVMRHLSTTGRNSVHGVITHLQNRSGWLRTLARQGRAHVPASQHLALDARLASPFLFWASTARKPYDHAAALTSAWVLFERLKTDLLASPAAHTWSEQERDAVQDLRVSDLRDGFAAKVLDSTNGDLFSVKAALGHKRSTSTLHYLSQRRQIRDSFQKFAALTGVLFDEASQGRSLDPKVLMARCYTGSDAGITEAQRQALAGPRTRMGMGCANPFDPPHDLTAGPVPEGLCSVQRCVLCKHGYFFPEEPGAIDALHTRREELDTLATTLSIDTFALSSYAVERDTLVALLERVLPSEVSS